MTRLQELSTPRIDEVPYPQHDQGPGNEAWPDWAFDNRCAQLFADRMMIKLGRARERGRGGWWDKNQITQGQLSKMLIEHLFKGDPIDVANFCMFLHARGESIARDVVEEVADEIRREDEAPQPAKIDAALGLVELPPIRVSQDAYRAIVNNARRMGLVPQAYVRNFLDSSAPSNLPSDAPTLAINGAGNVTLDSLADFLAARMSMTVDRRVADLQAQLVSAESAAQSAQERLQQANQRAERFRGELAHLINTVEGVDLVFERAKEFVASSAY